MITLLVIIFLIIFIKACSDDSSEYCYKHYKEVEKYLPKKHPLDKSYKIEDDDNFIEDWYIWKNIFKK